MPDDQVTNDDPERKRAKDAVRAAMAELRLSAPWFLRLSGDPTHRAAYAMAMTALNALTDPNSNAAAVEDVREWSALKHGVVDAQSQARAILDIADAVTIAASLRKHRGDDNWAEDRADPRFSAAERNAIPILRARLVASHGEDVPCVAELENWIDCHAENGARGRLTTAGIVARVMQGGRLLGASGTSEDARRRTLQRVTKVLQRRAEREAKRAAELEGGGHGSPPPSLVDGATTTSPPLEPVATATGREDGNGCATV